MAKSYNWQNIRKLLTEAFTDEELRRFCFDSSEFRPVYEQLSQQTGKTQIIQLLLDHADRKNLVESLLLWAKEQSPVKYENYHPYVVEQKSNDLLASTSDLVKPPANEILALLKQNLAVIIGILLALLFVIALFLLPGLLRDVQALRQPGEPLASILPVSTSTPTPTFTITPPPPPTPVTPMPGKSFNIAVAQFTALDETNHITVTQESQELSRWLFAALKKGTDQLPPYLSLEVREPALIGPVIGQATETRTANAARLATQHNATLVIYGIVTTHNYDYTMVPEFYVADKGFNYGSEIVGSSRLGQMVSFQDNPAALTDANEKLHARIQALQLVVNGLAYFYVNRNNQAYAEFEQALRIPGWTRQEGHEVVYMLMGAAKLRLYGDQKASIVQRTYALTEAVQAFEEAQNVNSSYARSYLGLGGVALYRATIFDLNQTNLGLVDRDKLLEAKKWYTRCLDSDPNQSPQAYVPIKAAFGLGLIHFAGAVGDPNYPGWSKTQAQTYFQQVLTAYNEAGQPADLTLLAARAYLRLGHLAGLNADWATMANQLERGVELSSQVEINPPFEEIAHGYCLLGYAQQNLGQTAEARAAYQQSIEIGGRAGISAKWLVECQQSFDRLGSGG